MRSAALACVVLFGLGAGWMDFPKARLRLNGETHGSSLSAIRPYGNVWDYMTWGAGEWQ